MAACNKEPQRAFWRQSSIAETDAIIDIEVDAIYLLDRFFREVPQVLRANYLRHES
jgi:hypothetical protein